MKGQKKRRSEQKTILITKVTETIVDHISEMSSERMKLFNRESEALKRRRAEYWLIMLIKNDMWLFINLCFFMQILWGYFMLDDIEFYPFYL